MLDIYGLSDIGLVRSKNQDRLGVFENMAHDLLTIVCDGIGGGKAGEVASQLTIDYLEKEFVKTQEWKNNSEIEGWLYQQIRNVNDLVFESALSKEEHKGMGTTLVGALISKEVVKIVNVGDSRAYALIHDKWTCLTEDHNYVNELLKRGEISIEQAQEHPKKHYLTNAIGIVNRIRIDIFDLNKSYETLLLCSDGLHGIVGSQKIELIMRQSWSSKDKCEYLLKLAKQFGGIDNITCIVIQKKGSL